jgi:hypothetical protein
MRTLHTSVATAHGGREGHVKSPDAHLVVELPTLRDASVTRRVTLSVTEVKDLLGQPRSKPRSTSSLRKRPSS